MYTVPHCLVSIALFLSYFYAGREHRLALSFYLSF
jgi:hypothetical protein